jgi:hypothetical protein
VTPAIEELDRDFVQRGKHAFVKSFRDFHRVVKIVYLFSP